MPKPVKVDEEAFSIDYRSGKHSNPQLGVSYGISEAMVRKLAKKLGLRKDIAAKVRDRIQDAVVRAKAAGSVRGKRSEHDVIEDGVKIGAAVVIRHSEDAESQRLVVMDMVRMLAKVAVSGDELEELLETDPGLQSEDPLELAVARDRLKARLKILDKLLGLASNATVARELANAYGIIVKLERQALNLDVPDDPNANGVDRAEIIRAARLRSQSRPGGTEAPA